VTLTLDFSALKCYFRAVVRATGNISAENEVSTNLRFKLMGLNGPGRRTDGDLAQVCNTVP